jgi:hypothetical protein
MGNVVRYHGYIWKETMGKSLERRVSDSFQGHRSADEAKEYSKEVHAAWKAVTASLTRSALLIFLLMAIFELLVYQRPSAVISIGSFTLTNAPIVQIVLPAVIAFIIYDGYRLTVHWLRLQWVYRALTKIFAPKQSDNDFDVLIAPSLPSVWGIGAVSWSHKVATRSDRFIFDVNFIVSPTLMIAVPIAFDCQAYYRLIQEFGYHNVLLWVSIVITVLLGVCTAVYVWLEAFGEDDVLPASWWPRWGRRTQE